MSFFKDLRRRRLSLKVEKATESTGPVSDEPQAVAQESSSSLNSSQHEDMTPASSLQPSNGQTSPNLLPVNSALQSPTSYTSQRPMASGSAPNRNSYLALNRLSVNGSSSPKTALSAFAPRVSSISENSWVHQKILLLYGHIGEPLEKTLDGDLTVCHHQDNFPSTHWPVHSSQFKALVHLTPGPNRIRLEFSSPKLASPHVGVLSLHSSWITVNFLPLSNTPPLHLAILMGKDSPGTYDAPPSRKAKEGNSVRMATQKFRMAAYLWQAFTSEQMYRQGFGRRCFRFEEEWQNGSLSSRDRDMGSMRNEAKVHLVRSSLTVRELRNLDIAQQNQNATNGGHLHTIAMKDIRRHFSPKPNQRLLVSVLLLDSHWDPLQGVISAHAALGGGDNDAAIAIFGSHAIHSYPSCLEEVVSSFSDCTRTDTSHVADDCGESGSNWEAANTSIGAHLHETGHIFGCPHQESGIMLRDYITFSRTFITREPSSTRTKLAGLRLVQPQDECTWHRLDALRFKYHPHFQIPSDSPPQADDSIQVWPVDHRKLIVTASAGIAFIEVFADQEKVCKAWFEYGNGEPYGGGQPHQIVLAEDEIFGRLKHSKKPKQVTLKVYSTGLRSHTIEDLAELLLPKKYVVKLPNHQLGFIGCRLGLALDAESNPQRVLLESAFIQTKLLTCIRIFHGFALDGLEFMYEDASSQLFGCRTRSQDDFVFETRRSEILLGFHVRAGAWIDGIQILTSQGRKSPMFGNANGGSGHTLIPPRGYSIAGVTGTCGKWLDSFSLIITR